MDEIDIRAARADDCPAIRDIYNHYVLHDTCTYALEPETLEERRAWLADHGPAHPVFVAETAARVVGWASLSPWNRRGGYRFTVEDSIYIDGVYHRRGLGRRLLATLIDSARALGHHAIIAGASAEQAPSILLHERLGFVRVGLLKEAGHKLGRWLDVVYLELLLGDRDWPGVGQG